MTAHSAAAHAQPSPAHGTTIALLVLLSGTFMVVLDFFIVMVALAPIQHELAANAGELQLIVTAYAVANAAGLITGGRLGDLYGRRRMFVLGLALFTLASAACGLASNADALIGARIAQGLAGALLQPQVLAMLGLLYTGQARTGAFAAYGMAMGLAGVLGQLVGGALIDADLFGAGWRMCFLINVPIGLVALLLCARIVLPRQAPGGSRIDFIGMLLATLTLGLVIWPLTEGRQQGWPAWSVIALAASALFAALFWLHQRGLAKRGGQPLVAPSLFALRPFVSGLVVTLVFYAGTASFYFVLALYLQQALGLGPLASGGVFSVLAAGFFTTSMLARPIARRLGSRALMWGALVLALGHAAQFVVASVPHADAAVALAWMLVPLILEGAGIGIVMAPLVSTVLAGLPAQHAGVASGVLTTAQQVGNALGVALIGVLFYARIEADGNVTAQAFALALAYLLAIALGVALLMRRRARQAAAA